MKSVTAEGICASKDLTGRPWSHSYVPPQQERGVFFRGVVYGGSGYAEECWVVAVALAEAGVPVQLVPIEQQSDSHRMLPTYARQRLEQLTRERVDTAKSIVYQHVTSFAWQMGIYGAARIGRTMFETDRIPDGWLERCNAMDEVWVPSEFNRQTFAEAGVDLQKLKLLHAGVDTELFRPNGRRLEIPQSRSFNFLSVFDLEPRKGSDLLLKAYVSEFKPDEDVALILKISQLNDPVTDPVAQICYFIEKEAGLTLEKCPPIILMKGFLSQQEMAALYGSAHAFVLPTHGEGYGRPLMEALSVELPVIATRWSGQLDFLRDENSYLIDIEGLVPAAAEEEIFAGHLWAQPSLEHLRQLMRRAFSQRDEARARGQQGRRDMVADWDWGVRAPAWVNEFRRILN